MWTQFLFENFHFAVSLFTALAFFSIFWLYFDAWTERKTFKEALKIFGFLLLSLSFLAHAILIESASLTVSIVGGELSETIASLLRNLGYALLIVGLITDPLIPKPKFGALAIQNIAVAYLLSPILAVTAAWLYLRRATIGLESHTKKVALAFFALAFYELLTVPSLFVGSSNVDIFHLVAPFGPLWITAHVVLLIGAAILVKWAFSYLLKRINTQLFIIFTTTTLSIFLLTTISFTFLLLKNLSDETLTRLNTDVSVLSYALDAKKSEALASASILSQNTSIINALSTKDRTVLAAAAEELLLSRKVQSVVIIDETGQVLARGEERDRIGDSLSGNSLVKRALIGESSASLTTQESALSPLVLVNAAVPIKSAGKVIGVTIVNLSLDNSFLDGIKKVTGLEVGIYGGESLSATTISNLTGTTRPIGIKNSNKDISNTVLLKGEDYSGLINLLNTSYFAVYHPLKDIDNEVVGMLLAGRPGSSIFAAAGRSIELTFLVTVVLMVLSTLPSFYIARYISNQLK
jgi:hypothetical protein